MKRDMDTIRSLLLAMERNDDFAFLAEEIAEVAQCELNQTTGLMLLLASGGYLEPTGHGVYRLTWAGCELLETMRDPVIWEKTKEGAAKVGSWGVKLLADIAAGYLRGKAADFGMSLA